MVKAADFCQHIKVRSYCECVTLDSWCLKRPGNPATATVSVVRQMKLLIMSLYFPTSHAQIFVCHSGKGENTLSERCLNAVS